MKKMSKIYDNDWPIVAICYDFDKTLSPQDMQNFALIPNLKCSVSEFWEETDKLSNECGMDKILAYMKLIVEKAEASKVSITREDFKKLGDSIELFEGVDTWFERINLIAREEHINLEHYIISAGLKEIIEGTPIAKYFTEIYASSFIYDIYKKPIWPCQVVNYTTKTQYLFRISKDCLDLSDEDSVNAYIEDDKKRIPLRNFIYIGDSQTDIPAMKIVKMSGGYSIGVYNPYSGNVDKGRVLFKENRIDYLLEADYSESHNLERVVTDIFMKIKSVENLKRTNNLQKEYIKALDEIDGYLYYVKTIFEVKSDKNVRQKVIEQANDFFDNKLQLLISEYCEIFPRNQIEKVISEKKKELNNLTI